MTVKSANFTEKFESDLEAFFTWASVNGYEIVGAGDKKNKWDKRVMRVFKEPTRNKLEGYVKELMSKYEIRNKTAKCEDYKALVAEYKKTVKGKQKVVVNVNSELDTSDVYYLMTLDYKHDALTKKLGKPMRVKDEKNRYEWKISIRGRVYSIYDWKNENGKHEPVGKCEWHVGGHKANKKDMEILNEYLCLSSCESSKVDKPGRSNRCATSDDQFELRQEFLKCLDDIEDIEENIEPNLHDVLDDIEEIEKPSEPEQFDLLDDIEVLDEIEKPSEPDQCELLDRLHSMLVM